MIAICTTYLSAYRVPLFAALSERVPLEVLCFGGGARYAAPWFSDLDEQIKQAPFPARRLTGGREALALGRRYEAIIAPFAGGGLLPAAYVGARRFGRPFILWASVWAQPRSLSHAVSWPAIRHIYRHADAVIAYGEHVKHFVSGVRDRTDDVVVAPQAVESEFRREVSAADLVSFRERYELGNGPLVLYVGRLVEEKGIRTLAAAWRQTRSEANLVVIGSGPLEPLLRDAERIRILGPVPRAELPVAYASASLAVVPSIPTPRFREPWALVCNEAMHQGCPVLATTAVGAVAGGLVRHNDTGWVVAPDDAKQLTEAMRYLLEHPDLRQRLGRAGRRAAAPYSYEAMVQAFVQALGMLPHRPAAGPAPQASSSRKSRSIG